ncbi:glycoside hydrolase family 44-domain-containing protein [Crucibulum laeve]|uniref:Glycoside hydrolase family 44-domain-containing protein n=1 Tax=Crucibulum laeve TaxID=68775 RepID=A0A5C3MC93_9AGAR|nr:glycoside hydrolase family 44-domain-containing protein [Crucibulum laeve]
MLAGFSWLKAAAFTTIAAVFVNALDDLTIYSDSALAQGWENWSWSSTIDFAATDLFSGSSSISVNSSQYAALSVKLEGTFPGYAGMRFDIAGAQPDIQIFFQSTTDNSQSPNIALSAISKTVSPTEFSSLLIDFNSLPGSGAQLGNGTWDRITIQAGGNGAFYHIDNIVLVASIVITPEFLSAEPLANNVVAVTTQGAVDLTSVKVALNGKSVAVTGQTTYSPIDTPAKTITYLTLKSSLAPGSLVITAGELSFNHTLPAVQYGSIVQAVKTPINPMVYGVNFPTSASYIQHLGVTISRWGGNAVTAYNPFGGFTNAGNDWYFENRASDSADDWIGWVGAAGSQSLVTIPALDWVSKDATSYSYPKTAFPDQQKFDPYNADAGNGLLPNGSYPNPSPDQHNVYTPWNTSLAQQWLTGLKNKPNIVTIDNEIEIASSTHQDMHPDPIGYDEELSRVVNFGKAAKAVLPDVLVAAPSTCSWWFYWTSTIGYTDNAAHNNIDFIPWFLAEMKKVETSYGKRLLDYLDIHYYFQADTSANDDAAKALRLRATRSLWDTGYVDESWVGSDPQNHQWNPTSINLIPRMKTLIAQNYPGTKLSISEWSSTNDADITGGLVTVDVLGLFGKYGVDAATYWATPDELGPVGLAYWLYRGYGVHFGSSSAQVNLASPNPDTQGVYAGTEGGKLTLVIVNKNPSTPVAFDLANVPTGSYFIRHFGGAAGVAKWQSTITLKSSNYIVVPSYTAVFLQQK